MPDSPAKKPRRFPRLLNPSIVASLASEWWTHTKRSFDVRLFDREIELAFRVSEPPWKLRYPKEQSHPLDELRPLLRLRTADWRQAIRRAYNELSADRARIHHKIDAPLYAIFVRALFIMLNQVARDAGKPFEKWMKPELKEFKEAARRKRGPHFSPEDLNTRAEKTKKLNLRLAKRYEVLMPQVRALRKFVEKRSNNAVSDEAGLIKKAERQFRYAWFSLIKTGEAFRNLTNSRTSKKFVGSLSKLDWTPDELTLAIMDCEEKARDPETRLGPPSINAHLRKGLQLLKQSSVQPKS